MVKVILNFVNIFTNW